MHLKLLLTQATKRNDFPIVFCINYSVWLLSQQLREGNKNARDVSKICDRGYLVCLNHVRLAEIYRYTGDRVRHVQKRYPKHLGNLGIYNFVRKC